MSVTPASGDNVDRNQTSYYASCVVHLTLRYDEALQVVETQEDLDAADNVLADSIAANAGSAPSAASALNSQSSGAVRRRATLQNQSNLLARQIARVNQSLGKANADGTPNVLDDTADLLDEKIVALQAEKDAIDAQINANTIDNSSASQQTATVQNVGGKILIPLMYAGDGFTVITGRVPITGNFVLPHPREAGTFNLTFDYREFPIDPRLLRAVAVEIHLGTVSAEDYARGMDGETDSNGRPLSILRPNLDLKNPTTNEQEVDPATFLMFGTVDRWMAQHSDHSSIIQMEGRDIRAIFIDTKLDFAKLAGAGGGGGGGSNAASLASKSATIGKSIARINQAIAANPHDFVTNGLNIEIVTKLITDKIAIDAQIASSSGAGSSPSKGIDTKQRIDLVVADIIRTMTSDEDFKIYVHASPEDWPNKDGETGQPDGIIPSPGDVDGLTRVRSKADGQSPQATPGNAQGGGGAGDKANYWDLITNYCSLVGAIPYLLHNSLWIRPARSVFDVMNDVTSSTFFANGQPRWVNGDMINIRRFVWGRNLKALTFDRKFAGPTVPTVQCVSIDDRVRGMQRLLVAQWPPAGSDVANAKADNEVIKIRVGGVRSIQMLTDIAHDVYEEIGRGEMGGSAETENLSSYGGSNIDPDVCRMRPTEPVQFLVDARALTTTSPLTSELNDSARRSFEEEVAIVYQKLGDRDIARAIVASGRNAVVGLLDKYQVTRVSFDWSSADGVKVAFDFQNYVISRHGQDPDQPAAGTKPTVQRTLVELKGQSKKSKRVKIVNKVATAGGSSRGSGGRRRK